MDSRPLFLDTNVYLGYALPETLEEFNPECCRLLERAPNPRYTSYTVKHELNTKIRDRNKLYRELFQHIISGKPIEAFEPTSGKKSDIGHLKKLVEGYKAGLYDLEYIRLLGALLKVGIDSGLKRTCPELARASNDSIMKDDFEFVVGVHRPDNYILADFFEWALKQSSGACFVTGDGNIDQKKEAIIKCVAYAHDCSLLSLLFVTSAARRFCPKST